MAYDAAARRIRGDAAITNFRPGETLAVAAAHDGLHGEGALTTALKRLRLWLHRSVPEPYHTVPAPCVCLMFEVLLLVGCRKSAGGTCC